MKNIKTSKVVALILSIAMILNVFAGLSLTSFAADDITVGMYFMENTDWSTPSEVIPGQAYTAVVYLRNYNATNAASYQISGLQVDVTADSQTTVTYASTKEDSGYSFDGTKNFTAIKPGDNGETIVSFASTYGATDAESGDFVWSTLASSETDIEVCAFSFTVSESATGTITFPISVIAADSSLNQHAVVVNNGTIAVGAADTTEKLSLYGPDLQKINSDGTYNIDDATVAGYTPFGTSWTAAGFAEGSSLVRFGYNNFVYLGDYDFSNVTKIEIKYHTDATFSPADTANEGEMFTIGLNKVAQSFGWANSGHTPVSNFDNAIAYGALSNGTANGWGEGRTLTITEGIDTSYNGEVYLTTYGCNGQIVVVTDITLYRSADVTPDPDPTPDPEPTPDEPTPDEPTAPAFQFNTDEIKTDGTKVDAKGIGATSKFIWSDYGHLPTLSITESFYIGGWLSTENGVSLYEYSVNGGEWIALSADCISARDDLAGSYAGYETAGYNITIPYSALEADSENTVDFRFTDGKGGVAEFIQYTIYAGTIVEKYTAYQSNIDFYFADGVSSDVLGIGTAGQSLTIEDTITISEKVRFAGWCVTTNGTAGYEYSLDGTTWNAIAECTLSELAALAETPYGAGYATARFDMSVPATAFVEGTNTLYIRGVDLEGNTFDLLTATVVYVPAVAPTYTVSVGAVSNGTVAITPSGTVEEGTTITVTATPSADYKLVAILVNGTAIEGNTFTVTADAVVTAAFNKIQYTVSVGEVSNGTVTLDPTGTVDVGTTVTVTATPATGYEFDAILVNGTAIEGTTFTVTADTVVTASFKAIPVVEETYTITIVKGGKGTGNVTVVETAKAGDSITLSTVGTVNGSGLACVTTAITSDDVTLATTNAAAGAYTGATFTMPAKNVTITVNFQILGDINLDGSIKSGDATALKRYNAGSSTLTAEKLIVANVVGGNNTSITAGDITALSRFLAGTASTFANGSY